ncbi:MAG: 16S rRNA (guanine(527)-N(7))-methyltransferase RsmG [Nitrospirae bacterium]|nr:16S rRNA (guanine(527)-N(7))-methyltransferase RsmG [Nitrospirota bacterium]
MERELKIIKPEDLLKKGMAETGLSLSSEQMSAFLTFLNELKKWNRAYNLTALKTDEDIIIRHFLDSALYLKVIPSNARRIADAGAGAGFPGIPIKILRPELEVTLIESSRKKSAFLRHIIRILNLDGIDVLNCRIETLGKDHGYKYDVIVSRAAFRIRDFVKQACPCLKNCGWLVLSKGPNISEEIDFLSKSQFEKKIEVVKLPLSGMERTLLMFRCPKNNSMRPKIH